MPIFPDLLLPNVQLGRLSLPRRVEAICEAISWPKSADGNPVWTEVWASGGYRVCLGKPGKEAAWIAPKKANVNDMIPSVFEGSIRVDYTPSFGAVWREIEMLVKSPGNSSAELLAGLLFRAAYMLDHTRTDNGVWRYTPPEPVVAEIERLTPVVHTTAGKELPIRVFLHLIEALSLNEDVKYYTLGEAESVGHGKERIKTGIGRRNNLSTCAHIIAVILGRQSVVDFGDNMSRRRGVAPLTVPSAKRLFPLLSE